MNVLARGAGGRVPAARLHEHGRRRIGVADDGHDSRRSDSLVHFEHLFGHYKRSKYLAEHEVLRAGAAGLPVVLVHPTFPVGEGDTAPTPTGPHDRRVPQRPHPGLRRHRAERRARRRRRPRPRARGANAARSGRSYILGGENMSLQRDARDAGRRLRACRRHASGCRRRLVLPIVRSAEWFQSTGAAPRADAAVGAGAHGDDAHGVRHEPGAHRARLHEHARARRAAPGRALVRRQRLREAVAASSASAGRGQAPTSTSDRAAPTPAPSPATPPNHEPGPTLRRSPTCRSTADDRREPSTCSALLDATRRRGVRAARALHESADAADPAHDRLRRRLRARRGRVPLRPRRPPLPRLPRRLRRVRARPVPSRRSSRRSATRWTARLPNLVQMECPPLSGLLAEALVARMPNDAYRCFFTNSGAESVETVLKFVRCATGRGARPLRRPRVPRAHAPARSSLNGAHEFRDRFGDAAAGLPERPVRRSRRVASASCAPATSPRSSSSRSRARACSSRPTATSRAASELCHQYGALLAIDEVQTGLGRTGTFFAFEQWNVEPDLVTRREGAVGRLRAGRRGDRQERRSSRRCSTRWTGPSCTARPSGRTCSR